jgi:hypothetical protein
LKTKTISKFLKALDEIEGSATNPIVMIRFNPDGYTTDENTRIFSPWRPGKDGILRIVKTRESEWSSRLEGLKNMILEWSTKGTQKTVEIIHMFYSKSDSV